MELKPKNLGVIEMVAAYGQDSEIYLLIMVCNSCVHFLQKFRPTGLPKDDLLANTEGTMLRVILGSMNRCYHTDRMPLSRGRGLYVKATYHWPNHMDQECGEASTEALRE